MNICMYEMIKRSSQCSYHLLIIFSFSFTTKVVVSNRKNMAELTSELIELGIDEDKARCVYVM